MDEQFDQSVPVAIDPSGGTTIIVTNTRQAAELLLSRWPVDGGAKHLAARKACLAVLEGIKKGRDARKAFEAAAIEANIFRPAYREVTHRRTSQAR